MFPKFIISVLAFLYFSSTQGQTQDSITYAAVIKFQSECCGVPNDSPLRNAIASFKKKYKIKKMAASHIGPMGKEGEYYLAFTLKELSVKQSACFIKKIKAVVEKMKDKGSAILEENLKINFSELPRVRISEVIF